MEKLEQLEKLIEETTKEALVKWIKSGGVGKKYPPEARRFCIPWAAGSGKTSTIIQFIAKNWEEGIIYSTWTIEELERVYQGILKINPDIDKYICRYHSKSDQWESINKDPNLLTKYRIVLVTDVSLLTIPPSVLLNKSNFFSETRPTENIRAWIILDEKPTLQRKITVGEESIKAHSVVLSEIDPITNDQVLDYYYHQSKTVVNALEDMTKQFTNSSYIDGDFKEVPVLGYDLKNKVPIESTKKVKVVDKNSMKARATKLGLEMIYEDVKATSSLLSNKPSLEYAVEFPEISKFYDITALDNPLTTVLNFDGTGDIILSKASGWTIAKNDYPYNFKDYGSIEILLDYKPIQRKKSTLCKNGDMVEVDLRNAEVQENLNKITQYIVQSIESGQKPLAVTWKDISSFVVHNAEDKIVYNAKLSMNDQIEEKLKELGYVKGEHYYLTYWMSGKTRGTNEFMDATEFLAFEPLFVTTNALNDLNVSLKTDPENPITNQDLFLAEFIQAIYRTQIRLNKPIKVKVTEQLLNTIFDMYNYLKIEEKNVGDTVSLALMKKLLRKNHYEDFVSIYEANKIINNEYIVFSDNKDLENVVKRAKSFKTVNYEKLFTALVDLGFRIKIGDRDITENYKNKQ